MNKISYLNQPKNCKSYAEKARSFFVITLVIYSILILLVPNYSVLAYLFIDHSAEEATVQISHTNPAVIKVVNSPINIATQVLTFANTQNSVICEGVVRQEQNNLVQEQVLVNFNNPANCFSLEIAKTVFARRNLSVVPLYSSFQNTKIIVQVPNLEHPSLSSSPVNPSVPIMPSVPFVVSAVYFILNRNYLKLKVSLFLNKIKQGLSLEQLQVFRC